MQLSALENLAPGAIFHGRYRVVRAIAAGSMGALYEVIDEKTDSRRALKVMLPDVVANPDHRARFAQEARVTGSIESDHVVRVSDADIDAQSGTPFLVMELLRGEDLGQTLAARGTLPPAEVAVYLSQIARALDKTHAAGIVHRDLKPENLFVTHRDDGSPCVKILDFGIAKVVARHRQGETTRALGTPLYMSPEQIHGGGEIGPRADLYALGHIAYTLLAGEPYWREESLVGESLLPLLQAVINGAAEPASARARRRTGATLPPAFDAWFQKETAVDPEARFDRASTAVAALIQATTTPGLPSADTLPATSADALSALSALPVTRSGTRILTPPAERPKPAVRPPPAEQSELAVRPPPAEQSELAVRPPPAEQSEPAVRPPPAERSGPAVGPSSAEQSGPAVALSPSSSADSSVRGAASAPAASGDEPSPVASPAPARPSSRVPAAIVAVVLAVVVVSGYFALRRPIAASEALPLPTATVAGSGTPPPVVTPLASVPPVPESGSAPVPVASSAAPAGSPSIKPAVKPPPRPGPSKGAASAGPPPPSIF